MARNDQDAAKSSAGETIGKENREGAIFLILLVAVMSCVRWRLWYDYALGRSGGS